MLLRLAALGALGFTAYTYYALNRERLDGAVRRLTGGGESGGAKSDEGPELAGGPLSDEARLIHAGEGPLS
jgi:hypothetical protein